jgi:uncharacterized protein (TIGR02271 family)
MKQVQLGRQNGTVDTQLERLVLDRAAAGETTDQLVVPVAIERLAVRKREVTTGIVHLHQRVVTREEVVDEPLMREDATVERVPVNRLVEGDAPVVREEDGVLVIPVLEEVLIVEKRLMLTDEVRVARRRVHHSEPQRVTLRRTVVDVERSAADEACAHASAQRAPDRC